MAQADPSVRDRLRCFAARYCPPWLQDQVDDIAQVAWLRIAARPGERPPGTPLLARVAYCVTVDEIRRRRRRREVPLGDGHRAAVPDPFDHVGAYETARAVHECLGQLLADRKRAVALHLLGLSIAEAATVLGWPAKRTENLTLRGLVDLRRRLVAKGIVRNS